jgi:hypothetical protein
MPPEAMLLLVRNLGHRFVVPLKITKGQMLPGAMLLLVILRGVYQSNSYKGGILDFVTC